MNDIASFPLAGVIGMPIAHTRSPQLHKHWLRVNGLRGDYVPLAVRPENLGDVIRTLPKMGFVGVNITVPHKEHVLSLADMVTDTATLVGAANTLVFKENGKIIADNTDVYGFSENLKRGAPDWSPKSGPVAVLGAGGAARAIIAALLESGVTEILISNRTRLRAEKLQQDFGTKLHVVDWVQAGNMLDDATLVVNTTSLGMTGKPELRVPLDALRPDMVVTDLVYSPLQTRLLRVAQEAGCTTVDGLGMLLYQAVPAFERWFGQRPIVDQAARAAALR